MPSEVRHAERRIAAAAAVIFDVLADPASHADIDGTGWVSSPVDTEHLTETGQRFRMAMFHENHPDKNYEMTNEVITYDEPREIGWRPGQPDKHGVLRFGGWVWNYELDPIDADTTRVTLTYDWSEATDRVREFISFPPFGPDHLRNSLDHLAALTEQRTA